MKNKSPPEKILACANAQRKQTLGGSDQRPPGKTLDTLPQKACIGLFKNYHISKKQLQLWPSENQNAKDALEKNARLQNVAVSAKVKPS